MKRQDAIKHSWIFDLLFIYMVCVSFLVAEKKIIYTFAVLYFCVMVFALILKLAMRKNKDFNPDKYVIYLLIFVMKLIICSLFGRVALGDMTTLEKRILIVCSVGVVLFGFYGIDKFPKKSKPNAKSKKISIKILFFLTIVVGVLISDIIHKFLSPAEVNRFIFYVMDFAIILLEWLLGVLIKVLYKNGHIQFEESKL